MANLSSDEVFTSPELANRMLDLLPQELFRSSKTRFLDPCSKSGVFLREIAKRLLAGLEKQIPDLQQRIDHIMTEQVFGIACTDLTAEMSRRTLYCTKLANGKYSVSTAFHDVQGNLRYDRCRHTWNAQGRCERCGASQVEYLRADSRETYAYPFIHKSIKEIFKKDMQFDVIIGNPPYQMSDGGGTGSSAMPIYQLFVQQAKKLNPCFLSMIIPARWYAGGKGLDDFRTEMLGDNRIKYLVDYFDSAECFPGVDLSGGVCYFLWDRQYRGLCEVTTHRHGNTTTLVRPLLEKNSETFVRFNEAVTIRRKTIEKFQSLEDLVSARKPFGDIVAKEMGNTKVYAWPENGFINRNEIRQNNAIIDKYKVCIAKAYGERGDFPYLVLGKPFIAEPNSCCTETYLVLNSFDNIKEAENMMSYVKTRFFRFLVLLKKNTQNAPRGVYQFVPMQDFSHPWTDEMLYKKYGLDKDEIAFIESMIRPME
ncbi:MAG: Eco57I restriction-modification methylase domain-containing protein [Bacteroidales bacterium]|nr:Eco57I restriction-modification methylase domain-containing protein [Bacteroidales bacterium]